MKPLIAAVSFAIFTATAQAEQMICQVAPNQLPTLITALSWDSKQATAKLKDVFGDEYSGTITNVRPHGKGEKVNLEFPKYRSPDATIEAVVFSIRPGTYQAISVEHKNVAGRRLLDVVGSSVAVVCASFE